MKSKREKQRFPAIVFKEDEVNQDRCALLSEERHSLRT